ncbi:MAG: hypothetical protein AB7H66_01200 [Hyphomonadaceae bacterium]
MVGQPSTYEREVRDTILKSSVTGVAATAIAIVAFSPAGFGDWIGASVASSFGSTPSSDEAINPYVALPPFASPFTQEELNAVRAELAEVEASLALLRAGTDQKIERVRALALSDGLVTFAPVRGASAAPSAAPGLRLTLSEPAAFATAMAEAPVEAYVVDAAPVEATVAPASYSGGFDTAVPYRDPHLELADLLLAHETF